MWVNNAPLACSMVILCKSLTTNAINLFHIRLFNKEYSMKELFHSFKLWFLNCSISWWWCEKVPCEIVLLQIIFPAGNLVHRKVHLFCWIYSFTCIKPIDRDSLFKLPGTFKFISFSIQKNIQSWPWTFKVGRDFILNYQRGLLFSFCRSFKEGCSLVSKNFRKY